MKKIIVGRFGNKEDEINYTHVLYEKDEYLDSEKNLNYIESELNKYKNGFLQSQRKVHQLEEEIINLKKKMDEDGQILRQTINGQLESTKRVEELEKLNERLYEINRETINSKRGVTPKKEHSAYTIKSIFEKPFKIYKQEYDFWVYKLQTPYSIFLEKKEVIERINKDLNEYLVKDLGIESLKFFMEISELKQFIEYEIEKQGQTYTLNTAYPYFHNNLYLGESSLLVEFRLTAHNGQYWDVQFFSKDQLKLDFSLIKV